MTDPMRETRLEELAQRLGARAAERLDVDATARTVLQALREPAGRGGRSSWERVRVQWLRIAAAVAILVGGAAVTRRILPVRQGVDHATAHLVADDLGDLSTDELRAVLNGLDEMIGGEAVPADSSSDLHELDAQQLRAVLRSLEG